MRGKGAEVSSPRMERMSVTLAFSFLSGEDCSASKDGIALSPINRSDDEESVSSRLGWSGDVQVRQLVGWRLNSETYRCPPGANSPAAHTCGCHPWNRRRSAPSCGRSIRRDLWTKSCLPKISWACTSTIRDDRVAGSSRRAGPARCRSTLLCVGDRASKQCLR